MLLLRSFEIEAIERTNNLISNKWRAELRESVDEFLGSELASDKDAHTLFEHDLLSNLKIRAQQELVCEQELLPALPMQCPRWPGSPLKLLAQKYYPNSGKISSPC